MAILNNKQLEAINYALNEEMKADNLQNMIGTLQQVYFDYTRLLVKDTDNIHPNLEIQLLNLSTIIQVLQKGITN